MKVLFAVNDESVSASIIKRYQKDYKEIISSKNVYYYNAIIKELQKDKSYDRIVIGEDLEPFSSDDYSAIDKFLFDKLDKISDEAYNTVGNDIPIILICTDRRAKPEPILVKLFGIGVYNALIGQDRSIDEVCKLIKKPRSKKEAKNYYAIDTEKVEYKSENENDVSEAEIQNILAHYKKLGKNEDKYVTSFENIIPQYNEEQLRLIINFLPVNVQKVLEVRSNKYRELLGLEPLKESEIKKSSKTLSEIDALNSNRAKLNSSVIIPGTVDTKKVKKVVNIAKESDKEESIIVEEVNKEEVVEHKKRATRKKKAETVDQKETNIEVESEKNPEVKEEKPKRRGRPPKAKKEETSENIGTKKKNDNEQIKTNTEKENEVKEEYDGLPGFETFEDYDIDDDNLPDFGDDKQDEIASIEMPGLEDGIQENIENTKKEEPESIEISGFEEDNIEVPGFDEEINNSEKEDTIEMPGIEDEDIEEEQFEKEEDDDLGSFTGQIRNINFASNKKDNINNSIQNKGYSNAQLNVNIDRLLTSDKKIVSFVGTTKNGTSFLVNNIAQMISEKGIKTAILDLSQNRNAYYVYTDNREDLRQIAYTCIDNLKKGNPKGIEINKNLTVFTSLPDDIEELNDSQKIIETLLNNYSLILLDCDFNTDFSYFNVSQELYLVQSLDVLTIQPLTAFLRELKAKNILDPNKVRIVINKYVNSQITKKMLIGGISSYNDPSMSYMTELFNKDKMKYLSIPFEVQNYSKYLESIVNCKISLRGYSKNLIKALTELSNSVFPLINGNDKKYGANFSKNTNDTLSRMKAKF